VVSGKEIDMAQKTKDFASAFYRNIPRYLFWFMMGLLAVEIVEHSLHVVGELLPLLLIATVIFGVSKLLNRKPKVQK
jgi:hypothetical protein